MIIVAQLDADPDSVGTAIVLSVREIPSDGRTEERLVNFEGQTGYQWVACPGAKPGDLVDVDRCGRASVIDAVSGNGGHDE